jgi:uncharacterized alkaline shock family protein YloU
MTEERASEQHESLPATGEEQQRKTQVAERQRNQSKQLDDLHTERGDTSIAETVVQKLAGIAAREVPGVYAMGSAARRAFSSITQRIPGGQTDVSGGVAVEKGERQAAIDVSIIVEYGASIVDVSNGIRNNIIGSVERTTGLEVLEVNVNVSDVHLPEDDDTTSQNESRRPE